MIDKANDVYNRWLNGQEIPTMILRHTIDDKKPGSHGYQQQQSQEPVDPFASAHSSLAQCIAEVHERAKILFPLRKPCMCSAAVAKHCPPSHSWAPPPKVPAHHPVLPPEAPVSNSNGTFSGVNGGFQRHDQSYVQRHPPLNHLASPKDMPSAWGEGLYSRKLLPSDSPALPVPAPISSTLSPASKMAVVDSLNFDLGAINSSSEQNWMAFF